MGPVIPRSFFVLLTIVASVCVAQRKEVRHLICTDVAARGIDIHGVPYGKRRKGDGVPRHQASMGGDVTS